MHPAGGRPHTRRPGCCRGRAERAAAPPWAWALPGRVSGARGTILLQVVAPRGAEPPRLDLGWGQQGTQGTGLAEHKTRDVSQTAGSRPSVPSATSCVLGEGTPQSADPHLKCILCLQGSRHPHGRRPRPQGWVKRGPGPHRAGALWSARRWAIPRSCPVSRDGARLLVAVTDAARASPLAPPWPAAVHCVA